MYPLHTPVHSGARFLRQEARIPATDPGRVLTLLAGQPRGFWGRGERWVAWGGAVDRIEVPDSAGDRRFQEVRRWAMETVGGSPDAWRGRGSRHRPRFFGGFAFMDEGGSDPTWSGFPSAAFILPRVLVESRPDGMRVLVQAMTEPGSREDEELRTADELKRLQEVLPEGVGSGSGDGTAGVDSAALQAAWIAAAEPGAGARDAWSRAVRTVLKAVEDGRVRKAVLARILDARFPHAVDPLQALNALRRENRRAHVFLFEPRPGRVFLGAAPEILAELRGGRFQATAVAGSAPRGKDEAQDQALAAELKASSKDRSEHLLTAEEMVEVLAPRLLDMEVEDDARVLRLARIQHLETTIRGRAGSGQDVLSLVEALHPTPAVCGRPRATALELIRAAEPFDRGWYAGPVGWFDPAGEGDFVPALRSAVASGRSWRLFAGAGIVEGSDPDAEWDETALKFEPALRALGAGAEVP